MTTKVRYCNGCANLTNSIYVPCKLGLDVIKEDKNYIRPNTCKLKPLKNQAKIDRKKAWNKAIDLFQKYIRYRDHWICSQCGKIFNPEAEGALKVLQAGHVISRQWETLAFDEKNCYAQCNSCNAKQMLYGFIDPRFIKHVQKIHGPEIWDYFIYKMNNDYKLTDEEIKKLTEKYEKKLNEEIEKYNASK